MSEVDVYDCTKCVNVIHIYRSYAGHGEYGSFCRIGRCWLDFRKGLCDKFEEREMTMTDKMIRLKELQLGIEISEQEILVAMNRIEENKKKIEKLKESNNVKLPNY